MEKDYMDYMLPSLLTQQNQMLQQIAMRPQKTLTTTVSVPRAIEDILAARNSIGESTRSLNDALKARESVNYTIANALMAMPQQEGYGSWLGNAARVFGAGLAAPTNAQVDRAQKVYEAEMSDLANRLALDKAMGDVQQQNIGYTPMEYGTAAGKKNVSVGGPDQVVTNIATATGEGIDPEEFIKKYNTGGIIETTASNVDPQDNPTLTAKIVRSAIAPINTGARSALAQNMTDKIIGPKIQNMIQTMGGARGADTLREVSTRIGPLAQLTSLGTQEQLGAISAAKTDVLDIINRDRMAIGMKPVTMQEFQPAWNRLFSGIATYDKQYGEEEKKSDAKKDSSAEQKEDYSKYGF